MQCCKKWDFLSHFQTLQLRALSANSGQGPYQFFFHTAVERLRISNLPLPNLLWFFVLNPVLYWSQSWLLHYYLASYIQLILLRMWGWRKKPKHVGERADIGGLFGHHLVCGGQSWWGKQELYFLASSSIMYIDILEKNVLLTPSGSCFGNSKTNQTYFSKAEWPRPFGPRPTFFS